MRKTTTSTFVLKRNQLLHRLKVLLSRGTPLDIAEDDGFKMLLNERKV